MNFNKSHFVGHSILVLLTGLLALVISFLPISQLSDDYLFKVYSYYLPETEINSHVSIVTIDDLSFEPGEPLSNYKLALLIERLRYLGVSVIGLSFPLFPQHEKGPIEQLNGLISDNEAPLKLKLEKILALMNGDNKLYQVIQNDTHLVQAVGFLLEGDQVRWLPDNMGETEKNEQSLSMIKRLRDSLYSAPGEKENIEYFPANIFMLSAQSMGIVLTAVDNPVTALLLKSGQGHSPSFILQLLRKKFSKAKGEFKLFSVEDDGIQVGDYFIHTGPGHRLLPSRKKVKWEKKYIFNANDILADTIQKDQFINKIVLIGLASQGNQVFNLRGQSKGLDLMESMAASIDAVIENKYFTQPDWLYILQRCLIVLIVAYLLILPLKLRGFNGMLINLVIIVLMLNMSLVMMILLNLWIPLVIPVVMLLMATILLPLHHKIANALLLLQLEVTRSYQELALNYQSQGQLDSALDCLFRCTVDREMAEPLYNLGMDFERRRQFSKALSVYERIASQLPQYRDIKQRRVKLSVLPECFSSADNKAVVSGAVTIVINDGLIARPVIGRYQIERELGKGAMGLVYLGIDPKISRTVAIKTMALNNEFEGTTLEDVKQRFYREAETAGQLNHPNIVTIYDVGDEHDLAYIAMDYVEGKSLDAYKDTDNLLSLEEVFYIGITIADALDYAHSRKVVHRDVKPANIMYDKDKKILKIMDFGIACLTDNSKTKTGMVLGSPFYMSPEQISGSRVDGRSDLFSLSVTLYQLFTGQLPFFGDSMAALIFMIANEKPVSIRKHRNELPVCLVRIINRAMEKTVNKRFQTGGDFADALFSCAQRQGLTSLMKAR